jgi:hypothetical protein
LLLDNPSLNATYRSRTLTVVLLFWSVMFGGIERTEQNASALNERNALIDFHQVRVPVRVRSPPSKERGARPALPTLIDFSLRCSFRVEDVRKTCEVLGTLRARHLFPEWCSKHLSLRSQMAIPNNAESYD